VGRAGRVVAFEPHPANVRALRRNVEANRLENVLVVPKAVSSRDGAAQLEGRNRATAALGEDGIDVETLTLDGFCDAHPELEPDLVKIDVEGHELDVLAGAEVVLRRARPALVVELHGSLDEVTRATARLGYECQPVGAGTLGSAPHVLAVFRAS
jgi:FkbM family methyltransferase